MMLSFKIRSATRAAVPLRAATSPARLATCSASTIAGITMARNSIAASTSASVKAAQLRFVAADVSRLILATEFRADSRPLLRSKKFLFIGIPGVITITVARFDQPQGMALGVQQLQHGRTVF